MRRASLIRRLRTGLSALKRDIMALWIAGRDPRTPRPAKFTALAVAAYALSPIDLVPDIIPILGYLDDVIILPLGIALAIRLIPSGLLTEFRRSAADRLHLPCSRAGALIVICIWIAAALFLLWLVVP